MTGAVRVWRGASARAVAPMLHVCCGPGSRAPSPDLPPPSPLPAHALPLPRWLDMIAQTLWAPLHARPSQVFLRLCMLWLAVHPCCCMGPASSPAEPPQARIGSTDEPGVGQSSVTLHGDLPRAAPTDPRHFHHDASFRLIRGGKHRGWSPSHSCRTGQSESDSDPCGNRRCLVRCVKVQVVGSRGRDGVPESPRLHWQVT